MTEKYRIDYTTAAQKDLRDIYTYVAFSLQERQIAKNLSLRLRKKIRSLGTFPERFRSVEWEPWASMGVRQMPVENYVVYYLTDADLQTVTILRIFYGGRDAESIIRNDDAEV